MILVTGGSGYVGSHIVKQLLDNELPVHVLVRNRNRAQKEGRLRGPDIEWAEGDVTKPETLSPALQSTTTIIHTVAIAIEKDTATYESVNTQGTINVVDYAKDNNVSRFINLSQLGADANLPYRFLASKGKAQDYVASSGLDWTAFRPSVIWGPEDEFANTFARLVPFSPFIYPIVDKNAKFQPVWVEDVATSVVKSINDPNTIHKEFELGGPEILTIEEIERRTLEAVGAKRILVPIPRLLLGIIVTLMEKLLPNPPVTRSLLEMLAVNNVTSDNAISNFVEYPKPFTAENTAPYMREFRARQTLTQFFKS
ncbi:MAG: complex I NDUFA9 subunit family protein [Chloroflexota bacterium]|nr:complex I NDUFA9 subunit family protein [Chloroflexota bacterium]